MAYAALTSLMHSIKRLKIPQTIYDHQDLTLPWTRLVLKGLDERSSRSVDRSVINALDWMIRDAAWELEDVFEKYALSLISQGHGSGIPPNPQVIKLEVESLMLRVWTLKEEYQEVLRKPSSGAEDEAAVVSPIHRDEATTVGLSDLSEQIRKELRGWQSELRIVSLVGMAGIGKTHLTMLVYHHPLIVEHFHSRVWVRVGPKDQTNNILVDIIAHIENKPKDVFKGKSERTLRDLLRNSLRSRRYLIVLDDIWTTQVLDYFTGLLPDYGNRSRFLLTTRLQEVAQHYPRAIVHQIPFLSNEESWNLLWQIVFARKSLPYELEKAGRRIAELCEGLPLLIIEVANILYGLDDKTEQFWKKVAEKKTTIFPDAYNKIYKILLSSYEYLPQYLKPCFLYMGVYPQSCEILCSKLFHLWDAEDFLEPSLNQKVEDFAMVCFEGIVSNSLAIVCKRSFTGIKSSKLHSAYWHVCVVEARKNKFFHALNKLTDVNSTEKHRRLAVQNNILFGIKGVRDLMDADTSTTRSLRCTREDHLYPTSEDHPYPTTRSLLCTGEDHQYPVRICLHVKFLKVLEALAIRFYEFPEEVLKLLQLRYLTLTHNGELPSSINKLQQLQQLILRRHHNIILLRDSTCLPKEIWEIQELRHVRIRGSNLPDPSNGAKLPNLLMLHVSAHSCTKDVFRGIPKLKKLGIFGVFRGIPKLKKLGIKIELEPNAAADVCLEHIKLLNRLESLKCVVVNPHLGPQLVVAPPEHLANLPGRLQKLSLNGLGYSWEYMSVIGSLPFLRMLKLRCSAFLGQCWETEVGQFPSLKFLLLEDIDLVHWKPQNFGLYKCYPHLCHLIIRHCYKLKMIPPQIGQIPTLETIEVDECSPLLVASAHQIKKKMRSLQLVTNTTWNL